MRRSLFLYVILLAACGKNSSPQATATPTPTLGPALGQIVYTAFCSSANPSAGGNSQIMIMDADGGNQITLTADMPGGYSRSFWSPDGGSVSVVTGMADNLAVMDVHWEGVGWVASSPIALVNGFIDSPTWSPDGNRLAFTDSSGQGGRKAYSVAVSGGAPVALTAIPHNARDLAWSPDGTHFAYSYYTNSHKQNRDIYIVGAQGTGRIRLTDTPDTSEESPIWSPDGRRIAFSAISYEGHSLNEDIYIINADGSGLVQVTDDPGRATDPAWSPDGTQLAFASNRYSDYEIFIINLDGTGEQRLTNSDCGRRWPSWRAALPDAVPPACTPGIELVGDVFIPPGTQFAGPHDFTHIWRVRNIGTCAWTPGKYALHFAGGEEMDGPDQVSMPGAIQPGAAVDLAVPLTAPASPGLHTGTWALYDGNGQQVPGPDGSPLTLDVSIEVLTPGTTVLPAPLYFLSARSGSWQVWRLETDGSSLTRITSEPASVINYRISPAGLAYVSQGKLYLADRDGGGARAIAGSDESHLIWSEVAWSPDGTRLAYALDGVHIYKISTGEDRLLVADSQGEPMDPDQLWEYIPITWSPDGERILAVKNVWEDAKLVLH